jgi:methylmalonyl-CoA/ethylmalonyl-CoA epimerase
MIKPLHAGISVCNLDESINWYKKNLDFELVFKKTFEKLHSNIAFIRNGNFELELFEHFDSCPLPKERFNPNDDIKTQGTKHICFLTDDIVSLFKNFKKNKVDIVFGPIPMENDLMGFIRDPSGVLIEIIQK